MTHQANMTNSAMPSSVSGKRRKIVSLDKKKARAGWIFVLPFLIGFVFVYIPIILRSIYMSFCSISLLQGTGGMGQVFVGFDNYQDALFGAEGTNFIQSLGSSLSQLVFDVPAILIFSLFMAVLLNQKMVGRAAFRAILFVPVILATGIMESVISGATLSEGSLDDGSGEMAAAEGMIDAMDLKWLFDMAPILEPLSKYVTDLVNNVLNIVNRSGVQMLIFLAGLQSISPAIYEACRIDGATAWETFWKITLPMISPMILVNAVYTVIDSFTVSNPVMNQVNSLSKDPSTMGLGAAMAWMYFLLVVIILAAVAGIFSAFVFYQRRDSK